jgi:hypothetical protein
MPIAGWQKVRPNFFCLQPSQPSQRPQRAAAPRPGTAALKDASDDDEDEDAGEESEEVPSEADDEDFSL